MDFQDLENARSVGRIMKDKILNMLGAMTAPIQRKSVLYAVKNTELSETTHIYEKLVVYDVLKSIGQKREAESYLKKELNIRWAIGMFGRQIIRMLIGIRLPNIGLSQKKNLVGISKQVRSYIT